jgi:predicted transcriptional regulator
MSRRDEATVLLRQGHSPSRIAALMHIRASEVMHYLHTKIGQGELRRSDIAFSLDRGFRQAVEEVLAAGMHVNASRMNRELRKKGITCDRFDLRVYLEFRRAGVVLGDMYEIVRNIEVRLHTFIKRIFIAEYGEENWWRGGVPEKIRAECAALLEKDPEPAPEPYRYTHLIALREILDRGWPVLSKHLPAPVTANKKDLLDRLLRLNRIRNAVMHPVRGETLTEEDFEFVYTLEADLGPLSAPVAMPEIPADTRSEDAINGLESELVSKLAPAAEEDENAPVGVSIRPRE